MASSGQLAIRQTQGNYVRGVENVNNRSEEIVALSNYESQREIERVLGEHIQSYDQTAKADKGKIRPTLVPTDAIIGIARIREYGCNKYPEGGEDNWMKVEPIRYVDALLRHALAFKDDPFGVDAESGLPHLWHIGCNYAFLCKLYADEFEEYK